MASRRGLLQSGIRPERQSLKLPHLSSPISRHKLDLDSLTASTESVRMRHLKVQEEALILRQRKRRSLAPLTLQSVGSLKSLSNSYQSESFTKQISEIRNKIVVNDQLESQRRIEHSRQQAKVNFALKLSREFPHLEARLAFNRVIRMSPEDLADIAAQAQLENEVDAAARKL